MVILFKTKKRNYDTFTVHFSVSIMPNVLVRNFSSNYILYDSLLLWPKRPKFLLFKVGIEIQQHNLTLELNCFKVRTLFETLVKGRRKDLMTGLSVALQKDVSPYKHFKLWDFMKGKGSRSQRVSRVEAEPHSRIQLSSSSVLQSGHGVRCWGRFWKWGKQGKSTIKATRYRVPVL